jgi:hypothetical protein
MRIYSCKRFASRGIFSEPLDRGGKILNLNQMLSLKDFYKFKTSSFSNSIFGGASAVVAEKKVVNTVKSGFDFVPTAGVGCSEEQQTTVTYYSDGEVTRSIVTNHCC